MNVFVLSTGRCGSTTFARACDHITNFSAAHESRIDVLRNRVEYPDQHVEVDNRLSWLLGRLDEKYGDNAFYVHQKREREATAKSLTHGSYQRGIVEAYRKRVIPLEKKVSPKSKKTEICKHFIDTVNKNIDLFLKDKSKVVEFRLESAKTDFQKFWQKIGAEGDLTDALKEWEVKYNATDSEGKENNDETRKPSYFPLRVGRKLLRVVQKLPQFIEDA
jgi:hypothetical protein